MKFLSLLPPAGPARSSSASVFQDGGVVASLHVAAARQPGGPRRQQLHRPLAARRRPRVSGFTSVPARVPAPHAVGCQAPVCTPLPHAPGAPVKEHRARQLNDKIHACRPPTTAGEVRDGDGGKSRAAIQAVLPPPGAGNSSLNSSIPSSPGGSRLHEGISRSARMVPCVACVVCRVLAAVDVSLTRCRASRQVLQYGPDTSAASCDALASSLRDEVGAGCVSTLVAQLAAGCSRLVLHEARRRLSAATPAMYGVASRRSWGSA